MQRRCSLSFLLLLFGAFLCPRASADIIVSFGALSPNPISVGGFGTLDVFARADMGTHALDGFLLQLQLTPTGGSPAGGLVFTDPQADAQLGDPGYVFFGNSVSQNTMVPIGLVTNAGSTYTGYDATNDFLPVTLTTSNQLIYRLDLTGVAAGTYDITANVSLTDSFFSDQLDPLGTSIPFTSDTASLTVGSAAAVPEPSSILLLAVGSGATLLHRRRQRRAAVAGQT